VEARPRHAPIGRRSGGTDLVAEERAMRRRPVGDDLAVAYVQYLAAWLGSWPTRRRLRRSRRDRYAARVIIAERRPQVDHIG
jgi:hypothetical protein